MWFERFLPVSKNNPTPFSYWEHRTISYQFGRSWEKFLEKKQCHSVVYGTVTSTTCRVIFNKPLCPASLRSCFRRTGTAAPACRAVVRDSTGPGMPESCLDVITEGHTAQVDSKITSNWPLQHNRFYPCFPTCSLNSEYFILTCYLPLSAPLEFLVTICHLKRGRWAVGE